MKNVLIKVSYLRWDEKHELILGHLIGKVYEGTSDNYRKIHIYEESWDGDDVFDLLEKVYDEHNHVDEDHYCRADNHTRSMSVGDLITVYDDDVINTYVVAMRGFDLVKTRIIEQQIS